MSTRIGLFGGTFDPIHKGHTHIARAFADELKLDSVIFLPAGDPYHKDGAQTPAEHRLAMTELAAAADPRFAVSDCDIVRGGATYTFDTVQIFRQQFPTAELWWLLGMDSLLKLHTWKKWQTLVRQTNIAVANRNGGSLAQAPRELLQSPDPAVHLPAAKAWADWESWLIQFEPKPVDEDAQASLAIARLENHYFVHQGWLQGDKAILANAHKIRHIPTVIVQGRYDLCTPTRSAWDLKQALPQADLRIIQAGHSSFDPALSAALVQAADEFAERLSK